MDGSVDGLDLGILLGNFNKSDILASGGELNGTSPVDGLDLGILLGAWSPGALVVPILAVPEPTSIYFVLAGVLGFLACTSPRQPNLQLAIPYHWSASNQDYLLRR